MNEAAKHAEAVERRADEWVTMRCLGGVNDGNDLRIPPARVDAPMMVFIESPAWPGGRYLVDSVAKTLTWEDEEDSR